MKPALRDEFSQQRRTLFGRGRIGLHILLWLIVIAVCYPYAQSFSRGLMVGVSVARNSDSTDGATVRIGPRDTKEPDSAAIRNLQEQLKKPLEHQSWIVRDACVSVVVAGVVVYTFLLFVIPYARYRRQKRVYYVFLILLLALMVAVMIASALSLAVLISARRNGAASGDLGPMIHIMLGGILVLMITGLFFSFYYFLDLYDQQKTLDRYAEVFRAKMVAETSFLKMQINPHFLFNSLNNIYALTLGGSPQAPVVAGRLKELVNYMLEECSHETVPLEGELDFLKNYLALEQLRNLQEQVTISCAIRGSAEGLNIAPLLLVNFIENAFKHGVKAGIDHAEVRIRIDIVGRMLSMEVFNTRPEGMSTQEGAIREAGGIGIRNVKRRLQILYPRKHALRINDGGAGYTVHLNVQL